MTHDDASTPGASTPGASTPGASIPGADGNGWALAAAQADRELLRVTLSSIGDAVIATDPRGRVTFLNPVAERLTGWPSGEAVGKPFAEVLRFVDATSGLPVDNPLVRALGESRSSSLAPRSVLVTRDGRTVPVSDRGAPIRSQEGQLVGAVLVFRDVTETQRAEEALHTLNADLERRVTERTADLAASLGLAGAMRARAEARERALSAFVAFTEAVGNETDVSALGFKALEVVRATLGQGHAVYWRLEDEVWKGRDWWGDFDPATLETLRRGIPASTPTHLAIMASPEVVFFDGWTSDREYGEGGRDYPAIAGLRLLGEGEAPAIFALALKAAERWAEEDRSVVRAVCSGLLIAVERGRAAAKIEGQRVELEARNMTLEGFAALSRDLALETDPLRLVGRAQEVVLGLLPEGYASYAEPEADGWRVRSRRGDPGSQAPEAAGLLGAVGGLDTPWQTLRPLYEGHHDLAAESTDPDAVRQVSSTASLAVVVGGQPRGVFRVALFRPHVWVPRERAVLETAARSLGLALERAEAVLKLAAQTALLQERNAEQETFVYTVSHDLRGPLLSIQAMGELLTEAVAANDLADARHLVGRVNANVEKMGELLNDLLTLSRVGRVAEAPEAFNLGEAVSVVLAQLEDRLGRRGVRLDLPPDWPLVSYGRSEAEQVLANLVGNAAKFAGRPSSPGNDGQAPRVALDWAAGADGTVTVRVSDNGPGVPTAYRAKVFELFQKLDPKAEGTGVGLAIVKRIVEGHLVAGKPGRVWVEDSPPPPEGLGGASFAVTLPSG